MNRWFQDGTPSSYKIQFSYVDIPPEFVLPRKVVDTPFRFRSYEEAIKAGREMFAGYDIQVVGSNDQPHWQQPEAQMDEAQLKKGNWYDVYGVAPAHRLQYAKGLQGQITDPVPTVLELQKLRPMSESAPSALQPPVAVQSQTRAAPRRQVVQTKQRSQFKQTTQRGS